MYSATGQNLTPQAPGIVGNYGPTPTFIGGNRESILPQDPNYRSAVTYLQNQAMQRNNAVLAPNSGASFFEQVAAQLGNQGRQSSFMPPPAEYGYRIQAVGDNPRGIGPIGPANFGAGDAGEEEPPPGPWQGPHWQPPNNAGGKIWQRPGWNGQTAPPEAPAIPESEPQGDKQVSGKLIPPGHLSGPMPGITDTPGDTPGGYAEPPVRQYFPMPQSPPEPTHFSNGQPQYGPLPSSLTGLNLPPAQDGTVYGYTPNGQLAIFDTFTGLPLVIQRQGTNYGFGGGGYGY